MSIDAHDGRRPRSAPPLMAPFADAGVLVAADVHVATTLGRLCGEGDEHVLLAAAFAVRAPRLGHVHADLADVRERAVVDAEEPVDLGALPWPEPGRWAAAVAASPLVGVGDAEGGAPRPLRLLGTRLHLDRLWRDERSVAADLLALAGDAPAVDDELLFGGLRRLFARDPAGGQALAAATAVLGRFAVIAGGPGTGKTTTVARVLALLLEQAAARGEPAPLVALAAPTGKAAARLREAVHAEAGGLATGEEVRAALLALEASTLHRLLGWRPDSESRFRHHRTNRLPHDVVVVDEMSMVSLPHMARLAEAVRPDARLVLVGDPQQLVSIEAGAVLGDLVAGGRLGEPRRARLAALTGAEVRGVTDRVAVLREVFRFGPGIARLAEAIRRGDADAALGALRAGAGDVRWVGEEAVHDRAVAAGLAIADAAQRGDARTALDALGAFRVLCAHRRGPHGAATWAERIEGWLAAARPSLRTTGRWYAGQPLLVTENDPELQLFNGDTGVVVVAHGGELRAAFERRGQVVLVGPQRLGAVEPLHAMTIHKSQGSQVGTAVVLLPEPGSRLLTRELLYTAVTRARDQVVLVGAEASVRAALARPAARASGLADRLA